MVSNGTLEWSDGAAQPPIVRVLYLEPSVSRLGTPVCHNMAMLGHGTIVYGVKRHSGVAQWRRLVHGRPKIALGAISGPSSARAQMLHLVRLGGSPRHLAGSRWAGPSCPSPSRRMAARQCASEFGRLGAMPEANELEEGRV